MAVYALPQVAVLLDVLVLESLILVLNSCRALGFSEVSNAFWCMSEFWGKHWGAWTKFRS